MKPKVFIPVLLVALALTFFALETKISSPELSAAGVLAQLNNARTRSNFTDVLSLNAVISTRAQQIRPNDFQTILAARKETWKALAREKPFLIELAAASSTIRQHLGLNAAQLVEQKVTLVGIVRATAYDDFIHPEKSKIKYRLESGNTNYEFYPSSLETPPIGQMVRVTGYALDSILVGKITPLTGARTTAPGTGPKYGTKPSPLVTDKVAVFLIKYASHPSEPFSVGDIQEKMSNGSVGRYYKEQSYNTLGFDADVYGWYTLPDANCTTGTPDIDAYMTAHGIQFALGQYSHVLIISSCPPGGYGYSNIGSAPLTIQGVTATVTLSNIVMDTPDLLPYPASDPEPFDWTGFDYMLAHEIGHALGATHAHGLDCDTTTLTAPCMALEYGNAFDIMGTGQYGLGMNASYKINTRLIMPANMLSVLSPGNYVISSLEDPLTNSGQKVGAEIAIPGTSNVTYEVEYRSATGFDAKLGEVTHRANTHGLFINKIINGEAYLLDIVPTADDWMTDLGNTVLQASVLHGSNPTFTDPRAGITIDHVTTATGPIFASAVKHTIAFTVTYQQNSCVHQQPIEIESPYNAQLHSGDFGFVFFHYANNDYYVCGPSDFTTDIQLPPQYFSVQTSSFTAPGIVPDGRIEPGTGFGVDSATPPGDYPGTLTITNTTTGQSMTRNFSVSVVQ